MNSLSHTIRNFNRFELKYVITLQQAAHLKSALRAYLVPDEHGGNDGRYAVSSLYYDSPGFRCYHEKLDGLKFRRKLRIRHYDTDEVFTEDTPVFLEIKQRVDRVTQKRRAVLRYGDALRLCNDRQIPDHASEDEALVEESFVFLWHYNLCPASIVRYERQALIGTEYDLGLRVTFDTALSFRSHPLHLHEHSPCLPMASANLVVMEIKVNERIPRWLTHMIAAHNLQLVRVSKYCRSIQAARDMPSMQRRVPVAESSWDVLASCLSSFSTLERKMGISRQQDTTEKTEASRGHFQRTGHDR